jgi:uncharacterized protein with GYD domain
MPKYLVAVRYTAEGARGVIREGGSSRRRAAQQVIESVGGTLECFYFALGETDMYAIADFPDERGPVAVSLAVAASGGSVMSTIPLLTPEQMDAAARMTVTYRPPGREASTDSPDPDAG